MGENHNNTIPAKKGSFNLSPIGIVAYLPIQEPVRGTLQPFLSLVILERADGEIFCAIDERWPRLEGPDE